MKATKMYKRKFNHFTVDDLITSTGDEEKFSVEPDKKSGKPRVIKKQDLKPCGCNDRQVCWSCTDIEETEMQIENKIFAYCQRQKNCLVVKTDTKGNRKKGRWIKSNPKERKGKQDLIICFEGWFIAVEVKKKNGIQSSDQTKYQIDVEKSGGQYWLVRSLDEFKLQLNWFKNTIKHES